MLAPLPAARAAERRPRLRLDARLVLSLLIAVTLAVDWQIAGTWAWPVPVRLGWLTATVIGAGILLQQGRTELAALSSVASLYAVPVVAGIVRWHLHPTGLALIGDGALQTQLAGNFLLHGWDPYGADYAAAGLATAPWGESFPSPALHHLVTFPGAFLLPLPFQAASQALFGWWDQRVALLIAAAGIWLCLRALLPGAVAVSTAAFFLLPGHSLVAVLGDNDLPMLALVLAALVAADRRRPILMGALLGLAVATKQDAGLAAPLVCLWAAHRGASAHRLALATAAGLALLAVTVLPFLLWNPAAFVQDTVTFLTGGGAQAYPINGFGLSAILLHAGAIHGSRDAFPFAPLELAAALAVWAAAWAWLRGRAGIPSVLTFTGLGFGLVLFCSRYFHDSHLVLAAELAAAGLLAGWSQRSASRGTQSGPAHLTPARPRT